MQTNYWIELPTNYAMEQMTNEIQLNKKKVAVSRNRIFSVDVYY